MTARLVMESSRSRWIQLTEWFPDPGNHSGLVPLIYPQQSIFIISDYIIKKRLSAFNEESKKSLTPPGFIHPL